MKWLDKKKRMTNLMAIIGVFVTAAIIAYPEDAFHASLDGLRVWWEVVFPALLPFFIAAEILMGLGVVHFMGALLEPLMRPVFRVPGVGAFAMAMGLASGYPIGAKITGRLRRENLCSRVEAERLLSFTNTADPLFMIGAVAVGMFGMPALGVTLAAAHYISAFTLGVMLRFYGVKEDRVLPKREKREPIIERAFRELYRARSADGRDFGQLLGDSVRDSVNTLLHIGGFIIMFAVIIRTLTVFGVVEWVAAMLTFVLGPLSIGKDLVMSMISGTFEITLGAELASQAAEALRQKAAVVSAIIAWSGLSVHAQVASMIQGTDIRLTPYLLARVVHTVLAFIVTLLIYRPIEAATRGLALPASTFGGSPVPLFIHHWMMGGAVLLAIGGLIALAVIWGRITRSRIVIFRVRKNH